MKFSGDLADCHLIMSKIFLFRVSCWDRIGNIYMVELVYMFGAKVNLDVGREIYTLFVCDICEL